MRVDTFYGSELGNMHSNQYIIYILNRRLLTAVVRDFRNNQLVFLDDNVQYHLSVFQIKKNNNIWGSNKAMILTKWILFKKYLKLAKASKRDQNSSWPETSRSMHLSWFILVYICSLYHSLPWGFWLYWVL